EVLVLRVGHAALDGVGTEGGVQEVLQAQAELVAVALGDQRGAAAALLAFGQASRRVEVGDVVARLVLHRRDVGQLALVGEAVDVQQQVAPVAAVLQLVVVAALLAGHVAVVEGGRVARTADIGRVVEEGGDQAVVLGDLPGGLEERVARVALHRAHRGARGRVKHVVFAVLLLVRGEEPQLLLDDRAAQGEGGVVGGEAAGLAVFVLGDQVVVLQVVVDRAVPLVATGLGDHLGDQARAAGVLGGHAAGDDLLLLDDLGVEVRTEGAGVVVGDVDAVDQVDVVGGAAAGAADVAVVDAGLGRRVAAGAGLHARDQLQVALVAAAGGQRFHHLQGQRGAHGGRGGVDGRQRGAGNDDRVEGGGIAGGAA